MGKKKIRKALSSKGQRRSIVAGVAEARRSRSPLEKEMYKLDAWRKGLNPWVTVPGPSSNMRFIRVRANTAWGDPRNTANIYRGKGSDE